MAIPDREFGALEQRVASVERTLIEVSRDVKEGNAVTDQIMLKISSADGGWRVLVAVGAAAAAVGGLVAKFLPLAIR